MATDKEYINFILEQLSELDNITHIKMMGEYIIYFRNKIIAQVCDNRFLVKPVDAAKKLLPDAIMEPPYDGAKDMILVDNIDDKEFLTKLFIAMYPELPERKKKEKKK